MQLSIPVSQTYEHRTRYGSLARIPILPQGLRAIEGLTGGYLDDKVGISSFSHGCGQVYQRCECIQTVDYHAPYTDMSYKGPPWHTFTHFAKLWRTVGTRHFM